MASAQPPSGSDRVIDSPDADTADVDPIEAEYQRLLMNCSTKRKALTDTATRLSAARTRFTVAASALSLLSAGSITAVLVGIVPELGTLVFAAAAAFLAGLISILLGVVYKDEKIHTAFEGAADYLALRENINRLLISQDTKHMQKRLKSVHDKYGALDSRYQKLIAAGSSS